MEKSAARNSLSLWEIIASLAYRFALSTFGVPFLLIIITAPLLLWNLASYPAPWYDEGVKTNMVRTLAERGTYATYTVEGYHYFDNSPTNGPLDTFAMAFAMKLFGTGFVQGRLVTILFAWIALLSLYAIVVFIYGRQAALFCVLFLLAVPTIDNMGLIIVGRQVLSEIPALAMISGGLALWFYSWNVKERPWQGAWAGILIGFGLLSKTQNAFAFVPSMIAIAGLLVWQKRLPVVKAFLPLFAAACTMGGWKLIEFLGMSDSLRAANADFMAKAVPTLLITDLFGRALDRSGVFVLVTMLFVGIATAGRLLNQPKLTRLGSWAQVAEALLMLCVILHGLWFGFVSIGWTRYAFFSWPFALLLLGGLIWRMTQAIADWMHRINPALERYIFPTLWIGLAVFGIIANSRFLLQPGADNSANEIGNYIRANVPTNAVIESWDWQVDVLSGHWEFHHPEQDYEFDLDRRLFHKEAVPVRYYDLLQANPDYLITGPFSEWTQIYDHEAIDHYFGQVAEAGSYTLFQRRR